ncbi:hypothetical protein K450DRAFT_200550 [Umbelopsis ramanniana AG]|uniref:Uncharacterized protein n=1 Tax=Umbelopsis ramanniana AG TaxID=1314678 RepID=A0AAD5E765_UMBRA|nr:uncharacterized protein K450DRAFT_200550 [Umbelopsis ramanniana AG]KAI8578167.1 hypothetical protein K450DRAFT_200550 [Umbelopsis ramanniana AG]
MSKTIDANLHNAVTNCTILDPATYSRSKGIYVNYTIPGSSFNYTQYLHNTDDSKQYFIGHIIPCFYALNDHTYIMAENDINIEPIRNGLIVVCIGALILVLIFVCLLVAAVVFVVHLFKIELKSAARTINEQVTRITSQLRRKLVTQHLNENTIAKASTGHSLSNYTNMLLVSCKMGIKATRSWMKTTFAQKRSKSSQFKYSYDVKETGHHNSQTG